MSMEHDGHLSNAYSNSTYFEACINASFNGKYAIKKNKMQPLKKCGKIS
jgi:hypothetical protein